MTKRNLTIAMVCDFFYPELGGVEMHIWCLSQCLLKLGHKVIVITHSYPGNRKGVRYMTNGLKVYYCPWKNWFLGLAVVPFMFVATHPLLRFILKREKVDIVHGHQAPSMLTHECLLHASTMGYKTVYTDHSLYGFADAWSVLINKMLRFSTATIDHSISVSHTCRENLCLRACITPESISVIPNAVDASYFTPDITKRFPKGTINIVVISRLVWRKGVFLLAEVIPLVCERFPNVHFIIGGDGAKKLVLEEMRENNLLHDRVEFLGSVPHKNVRDVLRRGHIFLNCSLTESFCIAILEAAACGLYIVSTSVGGVPEVLPSEMISLSAPNPLALVQSLAEVIPIVETQSYVHFNERVREMYSWNDVASRTERVYENVMMRPSLSLLDRLWYYRETGTFFGLISVWIVLVDFLLTKILNILCPIEDIEIAPNFPLSKYLNSGNSEKSDSATVNNIININNNDNNNNSNNNSNNNNNNNKDGIYNNKISEST